MFTWISDIGGFFDALLTDIALLWSIMPEFLRTIVSTVLLIMIVVAVLKTLNAIGGAIIDIVKGILPFLGM